MNTDGFERWLKETIGLDASTIGPTVVRRALGERMAACGSGDLAGYWAVLRASPVEQQELIETVVVPETWFFRDAEAFAALVRIYDAAWSAAHPADRLHLLSLPCSTGEEPYTTAMALLDAGFAPAQLRIDAVDISERALAKARRGLYGGNSFRGRDLQYRDRHFAPAAGGWQLSETIRACVGFMQGNVLDIGFLPGEAVYDAIFCRNLLIYFDPQTQQRAVEVLTRLLRPQGVLFVGPAETGLMLSLGFRSAQMPMAFAFRKPQAASQHAVPAPAAEPLRSVVSLTPPAPKPKPAPKPPPKPQPMAAPTASAESLLDAAQAQADGGRFDEALASCRAHLQAHGPSLRALYLMGLVHGATGRSAEAEDCFRKVLYLQADHEEALMHLALLLDARGDAAGARVLRIRAQRHRRTVV